MEIVNSMGIREEIGENSGKIWIQFDRNKKKFEGIYFKKFEKLFVFVRKFERNFVKKIWGVDAGKFENTFDRKFEKSIKIF